MMKSFGAAQREQPLLQRQFNIPAQAYAEEFGITGKELRKMDGGLSREEKKEWGKAIEALPYARLAQDVYDKNKKINDPVGEWEIIGDKRVGSGKPQFNRKEMREGGGFHARTYYSKKRNEIVTAFEGTKSIIDLNPDYQTEAALAYAEDVLEMAKLNSNTEVIFTGHSLGGFLAQVAGATFGNKAFTFNPAVNRLAGFGSRTAPKMANVLEKGSYPNILNVFMADDQISGFLGVKAGESIDLDFSTGRDWEFEHGIKYVVEKLEDLEAFYDRFKQEEALAQQSISRRPNPQTGGRTSRADTRMLQNMLSANTNAGNSCIVAASAFTGQSSRQVQNDEQQRVYDTANTRNNAREEVHTDGTILEAPVDIVLNWGDTPSILDSHLTGPSTDGRRFHIGWFDQGVRNSGQFLYTDRTGHGAGGNNLPEQTRINDLNEGIYRFYVHDFTGSQTGRPEDLEGSTILVNSGATVSIHVAGSRTIQGEGRNLGRTLWESTVPANGVGNTWHAFDLDSRTGVVEGKTEFRDRNVQVIDTGDVGDVIRDCATCREFRTSSTRGFSRRDISRIPFRE
ncbi:MAG: hypothetical protein OXU61_12405 [Gammaproteobacteria bacterium]|nr:hypothetical protein [Gammaproteobacteria bacterium]